ncbi:MAG: hypothetical protein DMG91_02235 [Acidobacteria bacterium]|nr:MAG: hypothetical protein DMG91_02235 [Acidobacteriota bacterium]
MNWDQIEGKWKQLKGSAKERWGKLTDDDLDTIAGKRDAGVEEGDYSRPMKVALFNPTFRAGAGLMTGSALLLASII